MIIVGQIDSQRITHYLLNGGNKICKKFLNLCIYYDGLLVAALMFFFFIYVVHSDIVIYIIFIFFFIYMFKLDIFWLAQYGVF